MPSTQHLVISKYQICGGGLCHWSVVERGITPQRPVLHPQGCSESSCCLESQQETYNLSSRFSYYAETIVSKTLVSMRNHSLYLT
jgi:hypothetical protein